VVFLRAMFTGIITETVAVRATKRLDEGLSVTFERPRGWRDLVLGESVATNGVCLTVDALRNDEYDCTLMPETLNVTAFGSSVPERVNLERALSSGDRFGGHFVQGHVDATGTAERVDHSEGFDLWVKFPEQQAALVINKGSIALNGVSLTVAEVRGESLRVSLIPHTLEHTTLGDLKAGDAVNLEFDMIGKYVQRLMETQNYAKG
jgi:riboflavin synthase